MKSDLSIKPWEMKSSFLSCEKDCEIILRRLFIQSQPLSDELKKLLIINTKDCLDNNTNEEYKKVIKNASLSWMKDNDYIKLIPIIKNNQHQQQKNYMLISFDSFTQTYNPKFRDNVVSFEIVCNSDFCDLGDYRIRPIKIMGIIDTILNNARLTGIGQLKFIGARKMVLDESNLGYVLRYIAVHEQNQDKIPSE